MTKRRVLVLNQAAVPLGMAGGTRHVELFSLLERWDATVVAGSRSYLDQAAVSSAGILETAWVPEYKGNGLSRVINWASYMATALVKGLRLQKPDVVWGSSPQMGAALVGIVIARIRRARFVIEIRDLWPHMLVEADIIADGSLPHKALQALEEFLYRSADSIVVLAEGTERELHDRGFANTVFVPNGADPDMFALTEPRTELRRRYGLSGFSLIYAGAHGPANGLDLVIDAAEELARRGSECQFVLVGDGIEKRALIKRVEAAGLTNVVFLDPVPKSEIGALYSAADAGLHCLDDVDLFKFGVSPNKLYDYMAAGLPVITNTGGDVAAMVNEAQSGIACAPRDIAQAALTLEGAPTDQITAFGEAGVAFMTAERSRAAMAARVEKVLDESASLAGR